MKKYILFFAFMGAIQAANCQQVQTDAKGNYFAVKTTKDSAGGKATATGKTYTDTKNQVFPVFVSARGKLFIKRVSKNTGNAYNDYSPFKK